jgi:hypothetical protein
MIDDDVARISYSDSKLQLARHLPWPQVKISSVNPISPQKTSLLNNTWYRVDVIEA